MTKTTTVGPYRLGSARPLSASQVNQLLALLGRTGGSEAGTLEGRRAVRIHHLDGVGRIAVKSYARGGWMRRISTEKYLGLGITRCRREFELLEKVNALGIRAPEPIAFVSRGRVFYLAWLVTRAIASPVALSRLSLEDEPRSRQAAGEAVKQIRLLVQHHILHVDLHPGNVVVDGRQRVFLVDFDRGRLYRGKREKLRQRYLARWERAVYKHRLPHFLIDIMRAGLSADRT